MGRTGNKRDRTARGGLRGVGEEAGGGREGRRERKKGGGGPWREKRQGGVTPWEPMFTEAESPGVSGSQSDLSHPALRQQQDAPLSHALSESSRVGGPC